MPKYDYLHVFFFRFFRSLNLWARFFNNSRSSYNFKTAFFYSYCYIIFKTLIILEFSLFFSIPLICMNGLISFFRSSSMLLYLIWYLIYYNSYIFNLYFVFQSSHISTASYFFSVTHFYIYVNVLNTPPSFLQFWYLKFFSEHHSELWCLCWFILEMACSMMNVSSEPLELHWGQKCFPGLWEHCQTEPFNEIWDLKGFGSIDTMNIVRNPIWMEVFLFVCFLSVLLKYLFKKVFARFPPC